MDSWYYDAEDAIKWWVSQRTEESVVTSFELLARFVQEIESGRSDNSTATMAPQESPPPESQPHDNQLLLFFDRTVLTTMIANWYHVWKVQDIARWPPRTLLKTLMDYERRAPELVPFLSFPNVSYIINAWQYRSDPAAVVEIMDQLLTSSLLQEQQQQQQQEEYSNSTIRGPLAVTLVNLVLKFWSLSRRRDAVVRAEQLFATAKSCCGSLDIITYNTMLDVYSTNGCAEQAEAFLEAMTRDSKTSSGSDHPDQDCNVTPDLIGYSATLAAWARSQHPQAPERAMDLWRRMSDPYHILGELEIVPETSFYNHILTCWSRSGRPDAGEQAHLFLNREMKAVPGIEPDQFSYGIVADAYAKCGQPARAEQMLDELVQRFDEHQQKEELRPNCFIFSSIMNAWEKSGTSDREQRIRNVFHRMLDMGKEGILVDIPDTFMYNHVIGAIVTSGTPDRAQRADEFLVWMEEQFQNGADNVQPNEWSYTSVICAYLDNPNDSYGLDRATQLLAEGFGKEGFKFNVRTAARVVLALAKANHSNAAADWLHRILNAAEEGYFGDEQPTPSLLGGVVASLFRASEGNRQALYQADGLVSRFCELEQKGMLKEGMDRNVGRLLMLMWVRSSDPSTLDRINKMLQYMRKKADEGQTNIIPDMDVFGMVVKRFAKSNPDQADYLFRQLVSDYRKDKRRAKPNVRLLNTVLKSWSSLESSASSFTRAESLLTEIREFSLSSRLDAALDRECFHHVLSLGAKTKNSATSMKKLIEMMKEDYQNGNKRVQPNTTTYELVIRSLCQEGIHEDAHKYLREACTMYKNRKLRIPPSPESFQSVIEAWKRVQHQRSLSIESEEAKRPQDEQIEQTIGDLLQLQHQILGHSESTHSKVASAPKTKANEIKSANSTALFRQRWQRKVAVGVEQQIAAEESTTALFRKRWTT